MEIVLVPGRRTMCHEHVNGFFPVPFLAIFHSVVNCQVLRHRRDERLTGLMNKNDQFGDHF
jgi:hypothetical protein